jgi:hypothetical protein
MVFRTKAMEEISALLAEEIGRLIEVEKPKDL